MKNTLKRHIKWVLLAIPLLIIIILISSLFTTKDKASLPPVRERETEIPTSDKPKTLKLVSEYPTSGTQEKKISPFIKLTFNKDIEINSIKYSITPSLEISPESYEHSPKEILIMPLKSPWKEGTTYIINISYLEGKDGSILQKPINYKFHFTTPEIIEGGESGMILNNAN